MRSVQSFAAVQGFNVQEFKDRFGRELPRFGNSRNVEMSCRGLDEERKGTFYISIPLLRRRLGLKLPARL